MKNHNLIQKWRVIAMLNNIKHSVQNEISTDNVINIINNYIKFTEDVKEEIYGK